MIPHIRISVLPRAGVVQISNAVMHAFGNDTSTFYLNTVLWLKEPVLNGNHASNYVILIRGFSCNTFIRDPSP